MQIPSKEDLPLRSQFHSVMIDSERLELFHRAFRDQLSYFPPTTAAVALKGVFELVDQMKVDWRKLLHATQSFEYHREIKVPTQTRSRAELLDVKFRANIYWLQFESKIEDEKTNEAYITSKSLIMVRAD